ncbi:hypothetical protein ACU4GG_13935 [Streptomyces nojiriensis]
MTRFWRLVPAALLICVAGCSSGEAAREGNPYDYATGYLSGTMVSSNGQDKGAGCVTQFQDYNKAMNNSMVGERREYFMKGCMDGFDKVSPAIWPKDVPPPIARP